MINVVVTVSMVEPEYSVIESEGEVEVCVELVGRTDVPVTVFFAVPGPPEDRQGKYVLYGIH